MKFLKNMFTSEEKCEEVTIGVSNHFNKSDEVYFELTSTEYPLGASKLGINGFVEITYNIRPGEYEYHYIVNGIPTICKTSPFRINKDGKYVNYIYLASFNMYKNTYSSIKYHLEKLFEYLDTAREMGDCDAGFRYGMYLCSCQDDRDKTEGLKILMDIEKTGKCPYIYKYIGILFIKKKEFEHAKYYLEKGRKNNCSECMFYLGKYYFTKNDLRNALQCFVESNSYGYTYAKEWIERVDNAIKLYNSASLESALRNALGTTLGIASRTASGTASGTTLRTVLPETVETVVPKTEIVLPETVETVVPKTEIVLPETVETMVPKTVETVETMVPKTVETVETPETVVPKIVETVVPKIVETVVPKTVETVETPETVETVETVLPETVETVETVLPETVETVETVEIETASGTGL